MIERREFSRFRPAAHARRRGPEGGEGVREVPSPSTGSTIQVGAFVRAAIDPASALDSSPISWSSGKLALTASNISFSFALSVSVTLTTKSTASPPSNTEEREQL